MTSGYLTLHASLYTDINATLSSLNTISTAITLGSSTIDPGKESTYENTLSGALDAYNSFLSESNAAINTFSAQNTLNLQNVLLQVQAQSIQNQDLLQFIRTTKTKYTTLDTQLGTLQSLVDDIDTNVLATLQNNITILSAQKADYRTRIQSSLDSALNKAIQNPHIQQFEQDAKLFVNLTMTKWDDYMNTNFQDDQDLLLEVLKAKNTIASEPALHAKLYDNNGNIILSDLSASGAFLASVDQLTANINESVSELQAVKLRYTTGSTANLNTNLAIDLQNAYTAQLAQYQKDFITYLNSLMSKSSVGEQNTALQSEATTLRNETNTLTNEKNALSAQQQALLSANDQAILNLVRLEDEKLRRIFVGSVSYDYAKTNVQNELNTLNNIAKLTSNADIKAHITKITYTYTARLIRRQIRTDSVLSTLPATTRQGYESQAYSAIKNLENGSGTGNTIQKISLVLASLQNITNTSGASVGTIQTIPSADLAALRSSAYIDGSPSARYLIVEYSDLECPYCMLQRSNGTIAAAMNHYATGTVAHIFRTFQAVVHPGSAAKAVAALCVGKLGGATAYNKFVDGVLDASSPNNPVPLSQVPGIAGAAGVSPNDLKNCMSDPNMLTEYTSETTEGTRLGVNGTPGNVIIDTTTGQYTLISGAYPASAFIAAIDSLTASVATSTDTSTPAGILDATTVRSAIGNLSAGQSPDTFTSSQALQILIVEAVFAEYLAKNL